MTKSETHQALKKSHKKLKNKIKRRFLLSISCLFSTSFVCFSSTSFALSRSSFHPHTHTHKITLAFSASNYIRFFFSLSLFFYLLVWIREDAYITERERGGKKKNFFCFHDWIGWWKNKSMKSVRKKRGTKKRIFRLSPIFSLVIFVWGCAGVCVCVCSVSAVENDNEE